MTEDTSPENLRKFLESDDPAMVMMGLSMAKGSGIPDDLLGLITGIYMWHDDKGMRAAAKSAFMNQAPDELKEILKKTWKTDYRKIKTAKIISNHVIRILWKFKNTRLNTIDVWRTALWRYVPPDMRQVRWSHTVTETIIEEMVFFGIAPQGYLSTINDSRMKETSPSAGRMGNAKTSAEAVETLTELLDLTIPLFKEKKDTCIAIIDTLGNIGDERAVNSLINYIRNLHPDKDNDGWLLFRGFRAAVYVPLEALKKIGEPAVQPLIQLLDENLEELEPKYLRSIIGTLGRLGDERAVPTLSNALDGGFRHLGGNMREIRITKEALSNIAYTTRKKKLGHEVEE